MLDFCSRYASVSVRMDIASVLQTLNCVLRGLVQVLSLIGTIIVVFLPNGIHRVIKSWGHPGQIGAGLSDWPTDFTRDILPIPCHSHNDYWRAVPLYSAIEAGCISVEADIWLFKDELYVGHSIPSLTPNRTLGSLYINPLLDTLVKQNPEPGLLPDPDPSLRGVFDTVPEQSLVLLIDFKTSGSELWPQVMDALEPLREKRYLTHHDGTKLVSGPITVVGTGNTPFDMIKSEDDNPHHDVFFDAPLNEMYESAPIEERHGGEGEKGQIGSHKGPDYRSSNSYYASTDFNDAIGPLWDGSFSDHQMDLLRGQLRGAHARGLKARYWNLPFWPIHSRNYVWKVLVEEGVDMLNVDDLKGATERNWDKHTYGVQSGIDEAE